MDCIRIAPIVTPEASVSKMNGKAKSRRAKIEASVMAFFKESKAC